MITKIDNLTLSWLPWQPTNYFWNLIALIGMPWAVVTYDLILAYILLIERHWELAVWSIWTLALGNLLGIFTKKIIKRARPITNLTSHFKQNTGYSFPSGHVLGITQLALIITTLWPVPWVIVMVVLTWLLVAFSRLFLRAHYPSDIIGTIIFTGICFTISCELYQIFLWKILKI